MLLTFSNGSGVASNGSATWAISAYPAVGFAADGFVYDDARNVYVKFFGAGQAFMSDAEKALVIAWLQAAVPPGDTRTLLEAQAQAAERIKVARDTMEFAPVVVAGVTYDGDVNAQRRIGGAVQLATLAAGANQPFSIQWTDANNVTQTLSGAQMIAVGEAVAAQIQTAWGRYRAAKTALLSTTTNAQADAVTF